MAKKSSDAVARKRAMQRKVLEYLIESGNVSYSCKRAGISRETYYAWRQDKEFAEDADVAIQYGKGFVNDLAHTQLVRNIQDGNMQAVRFQLVSCHPDYQPKRPTSPEQRLVPITAINIMPSLDPAKLAEAEAKLKEQRDGAGQAFVPES